jgi:signal transduction histidine kinase
MITLPKRMSPSSATAISLSALALVGYIDFVTGELSLILLYFVPIGIEAWFVGRKASLVLSFLALGTWLSAYLTHEYNGATSACWDTAITLGIFISYSLLLSALRTARSRMEKIAKELARSNRDLQQFAYIASHDLQEPLRTAKGFLQLFEQRYGARLDLKALEYGGVTSFL